MIGIDHLFSWVFTVILIQMFLPANPPAAPLSTKLWDITVLIAALGYFIDMFDFFLYNMVRVPSLTAMGLSGEALTQAGLMISSWQMAGIFLGATLWGMLGDKIGRKKGLLASIFVYGLGSLATACVHSPETYAAARFVTALGLAGEIGAGVALITERLAADKRGYGVMIFLSAGYIGVITAGLCASWLPWRMDYIVGGVAGLAILLTRTFLPESNLFLKTAGQSIARGFMPLLCQPRQALYFICGIGLMMTCTFVPQIVWTLSPEIGHAMGLLEPVKASTILMIGFSTGIAVDIFAQFLSEKLKSRKKATLIFLTLSIVSFIGYLFWPHQTYPSFVIFNCLMAFTYGIWLLTATWTAEHFGTNLRATVATATPSFSRAMTVMMNLAYGGLKDYSVVTAVGIIGMVIFALASLGWLGLRETYGKDLDYST